MPKLRKLKNDLAKVLANYVSFTIKFYYILFSRSSHGFEAVNLSTNVFNFINNFVYSLRAADFKIVQQSTAGFWQIVFQLTLWDYLKSQTAGKLINWNRTDDANLDSCKKFAILCSRPK